MIQVELYIECDQPGCDEALEVVAQDRTRSHALRRVELQFGHHGWSVGRRRQYGPLHADRRDRAGRRRGRGGGGG